MTKSAQKKAEGYEESLSYEDFDAEAKETLDHIVEFKQPVAVTPVKPNREFEVMVIGPNTHQKTLRPIARVEHPDDVRLMEMKLVYAKGNQWFVREDDFEAAQKPYDFKEEIEKMCYTPTEILHALYWGGHFTQGINARELIASLIRAGKLPVKKK